MDTLFYVLESIGIISFALSGMLMAEKKDFDPVGWYVIACVTAFGGGTLRDLILDVQPVYWIAHPEYPVIILALCALFYFVYKIRFPSSWLIVSDALGLALFSLTAAQSVLALGHPTIIVGMLSVMAATFGGLIRDVLCGEVPMIFQKVSFYASVSFSGVMLYCGLVYFGAQEMVAMGICSLFIFVFRMLAVKLNLRFR